MNLLRQIFKQAKRPHPFIFNGYSIGIPFIITVAIIIILAPQQFQDFSLLKRSLFAFFIGLLVSGTIFLTVRGLQQLCPQFMHEDTWTVGKEGLLYLIVLLIINILIFGTIFLFFSGPETFVQQFWRSSFYTLGIGIFPIMFLILFEQYHHQKSQFIQAYQLTQSLQAEKRQTESRKQAKEIRQLQFKAENGNIELQLMPEEILCLKSDGNYVEVFYLLQEGISVKLIRNKLKYLEAMLPDTHFFRCHNRYIVNGNHIVNINGNARNLELTIRNLDLLIPVSRSKVKAFEYFLSLLT